MAKSIRINLSLPAPLHELYASLADRIGVSLPQVLVNALAAQVTATRQAIGAWDARSDGRDVNERSSQNARKLQDPGQLPGGGLTRKERRLAARMWAKEKG